MGWNVPVGQGVQGAVPSSPYEPAIHGVASNIQFAVSPVADVPTSQFEQDPGPVLVDALIRREVVPSAWYPQVV